MLVLAVCSALLAAGAALQCEVCSAINVKTCSGHYEMCTSPKSQCMVTLTETSLGAAEGIMQSVVLEKSCGDEYNCVHPATLTTKEFSVRVITKCCGTDFCNNGSMEMKPPNSTLNGVTCESCFARNSQACNVRTPLNCTGDETNCVQYVASRLGGSTITVEGCASESMQRSQGKAAFQGSSVRVKEMQNRSGAEAPRCGLFLLLSLTWISMKILSQ